MSVTRRGLILLALMSAAGPLLGGCGQKGPLYLPGESEEDKDKDKKESAARARRSPPRT